MPLTCEVCPSSVRTVSPVAKLFTSMEPLWSPTASSSPHSTFREVTSSENCSVRSQAQVVRSQILTLRSFEPESSLPSCSAKAYTKSVWPVSVRWQVHDTVLHTLMVLSAAPETSASPHIKSERTPPVCPSRVRSCVQFVTFQTIKERDQCLHAFLQSDREIVSHILSGRRTLRGAMKNETPLLTAKFGQNKHVAGVSYADVDVICSAAPEPEDIYWENLGTPRAQQLRAFWFTMLVLTILLGASAGIMVYIKHIVNDAKARTACCVGIIYETELARLQGVYDIWNASGPTFNETVWGPDAAANFAAVMADTGNASDYGSGIYDELQTVASWETATCEYERRDDYLLKDIVNQKSCVFVGIDFGGIDYSGITDKDSYTASDFVLFVLVAYVTIRASRKLHEGALRCGQRAAHQDPVPG